MKKNYFMLAAATMMFAACAETDLVNEINEAEAQYAIGFETFTNKATRAANTDQAENSTGTYSNGELKTHHATFSVWAYKNTSDVLVFGNNTSGTEVDASSYEYGTKKYWDKTATKYEFFAAAPSTAAWEFVGQSTAANQHESYFKMTNAVLKAKNFVSTPNEQYIQSFKGTGPDLDVDWMIADKCPITNFNDIVSLSFIHILSRLNIIVKKKSDSDPAITLNSVTVNGLNLKGTFNEGTAAAASGTTTRWTPASPAETTTAYSYATDFALTTANNYVLQSLVIPQNVTFDAVSTDGKELAKDGNDQAYVEIIYTISGEEFKAYYNLAAVFGADAVGETVAFNEGWQNTLTITISANAIAFTSNVATWADGTPAGSENIE